jgi:hypothetical protein
MADDGKKQWLESDGEDWRTKADREILNELRKINETLASIEDALVALSELDEDGRYCVCEDCQTRRIEDEERAGCVCGRCQDAPKALE